LRVGVLWLTTGGAEIDFLANIAATVVALRHGRG
jgi:hypothetical protein